MGAIALEAVVLRLRGPGWDRPSARASVLSGIGAFGGLALANRVVFIGLMHTLWAHRLVDLGTGALGWLAAFLLYDLAFYVAHRAGHEVRLLWCFHSVHHTSTRMQLTSAIRGSVFDFVYLPWFFVGLPLLGVHPSLVLLVEVFGRLWGVAVHVSPALVGGLARWSRWVITPGLHRVHHGREDRYLDRNYGEVLAVWDRLFATWQAEEEPPTYGLGRPVDPHSLADIQLSPWRALWAELGRAPDLWSRVRLCLDAPGWSPGGPDRRVRTRRARGELPG